MRKFSGGYRKNEFDKQMDKGAVKMALGIRAKHRAELKRIEEEAEQREIEKALREAAEKFEKLKAS